MYLVLQTHGTSTAELLTEDAMAMCLLDMVQTIIIDIQTGNLDHLNTVRIGYFGGDSSAKIGFESLRAIITKSTLSGQLIRAAEEYTIQKTTILCAIV